VECPPVEDASKTYSLSRFSNKYDKKAVDGKSGDKKQYFY
jgi:hypothetical protein